MQTAIKFVQEVRRVGSLLPPRQYLLWLSLIAQNWMLILRDKSLGSADGLFGEEFSIRWRGRTLHVRSMGLGVVREIFGQLCYARPGELLCARNVLDLGANAGAFTLFALLEAPRAKVHAVEAQQQLAKSLHSNVLANDLTDRVTVETAVVGGFRNAWTQDLKRKVPELHCFDIQGYLDRVGMCDFLKCDVEGGEFGLFEGDLSWTNKIRRIALEFHPKEGDVNALRQKLENANYRVKQADHGHLGYLFCSK